MSSSTVEMPSPALGVSEPSDDLILPSPPTEEQKWAYFGPQRRWVPIIGGLTFVPIIGAQIRVATHIPGLQVFWASALLVMATAALFLITGTRRRRMTRAEHMELVASYEPDVWPSVDIFLPTAGERLEVLANTYQAVAALSWPGNLQVYVLDDSGRSELADLVEEFGFNYRSRPDRGHMKKAGNLAYGYGESIGDLIVVFDADFAPRSDFVLELAPYFDDESVGIVQSPQFFDTLKRMNWLQRGAGTTQEFFYRWVQPSRDAIGAPICVGTNAVYRREALEAAGGFAQIGHSEDVHTGVKCMRAGYEVRYVPVNLAKGLCPEDLDQFVHQQYRWCAGSMSLLRDRNFHKLKLGWRRKLCFFSGFGYYLGTATLVFVAPIPAILLVWVHPDLVHLKNYLVLIGAVAFGWLIMPRLLFARWGPELFRVQIAYSYAHSIAIWHVLRGRTAAWVATGTVATETPLAVQVRRIMNVWVPCTQILLWGGLFTMIARTGEHSYLFVFVPMLILGSIVQVPLVLRVDECKRAFAAAKQFFTPKMPSDVFTAMSTLAVSGSRAVAPMALVVAASFAVVTGVAGWTVTKISHIENAIPAQTMAEIQSGHMPDSLGADHDRARTQPVVVKTPVASHSTEADGASGTKTKHPATQPCVTSTVNPSRAVVDTTIDGDHYYAGITQSITFCALEGSAPVVSSASATASVDDTFLVRIHVDGISTHTESGGCQVIPGPCVRVITSASGHAGTAAKEIASGSADVITEIGDRGQTVTTLAMG